MTMTDSFSRNKIDAIRLENDIVFTTGDNPLIINYKIITLERFDKFSKFFVNRS